MKEWFFNTPLILDIEQILEVLGYVLTLKPTATGMPPRLSLIAKTLQFVFGPQMSKLWDLSMICFQYDKPMLGEVQEIARCVCIDVSKHVSTYSFHKLLFTKVLKGKDPEIR